MRPSTFSTPTKQKSPTGRRVGAGEGRKILSARTAYVPHELESTAELYRYHDRRRKRMATADRFAVIAGKRLGLGARASYHFPAMADLGAAGMSCWGIGKAGVVKSSVGITLRWNGSLEV